MGSVKIGKYIRLNASRSGISVSGGVKGLRLSVGTKGIRTHVTVPGTGYTKTNTLLSFKKLWKKHKKKKTTTSKSNKSGHSDMTATASKGDAHGAMNQEDGMVQDELLLVLDRRRTMGRFTSKAKGDRLYNKAVEAYNQQLFEEALTLLEEAMTYLPEDQEIKLILSVICYLYIEDYRKAIDYFDQLEEANYNEDMKLAIADCLFELKDYDYAETVLESFTFPDEEDIERLLLLARCHLAGGRFIIAEGIIEKARSITNRTDEREKLLDYCLGSLYLETGHFDEAKDHLMKVYVSDGDFEDIDLLVERLALSGQEAERLRP